jgi:hypothetical protein
VFSRAMAIMMLMLLLAKMPHIALWNSEQILKEVTMKLSRMKSRSNEDNNEKTIEVHVELPLLVVLKNIHDLEGKVEDILVPDEASVNDVARGIKKNYGII